MVFFKDVITEFTEEMQRIVSKKNFRRCPKCRKGTLKKTGVVQHYSEVAASKLASAIIAGAVPAPDYRFKCPNCGAICVFVEGKYVPLPLSGK